MITFHREDRTMEVNRTKEGITVIRQWIKSSLVF